MSSWSSLTAKSFWQRNISLLMCIHFSYDNLVVLYNPKDIFSDHFEDIVMKRFHRIITFIQIGFWSIFRRTEILTVCIKYVQKAWMSVFQEKIALGSSRTFLIRLCSSGTKITTRMLLGLATNTCNLRPFSNEMSSILVVSLF